MSKFKVGERVIIMAATSLNGKDAIVVRAHPGRGGVDVCVQGYSDQYWYGDHEVQLVPAARHKPALPTNSDERKKYPLFSGLLAYFPAALAQVSNHSYIGNEKHNKGLPLQHARGVSGDHADCVLRHLMDAAEYPVGSPGRIDELRGVAWRALALLQEECEAAGTVAAPAATFDRAAK